MTSETPRFSIIIPTRNRVGMLQQVLDALLQEEKISRSAYEIIVVDDASTDLTPHKMASWPRQASTSTVVVTGIRAETRGGPGACRNLGIQAARGEIIAFTDDDCLPARDWLHRLDEAWRQGEAAPFGLKLAGIGGRTLISGPAPATLAHRYMRAHHWWETPKLSGQVVEYLLTCNGSFRRAALLETGGFDPGYGPSGGEDADLGRRLVAAGYILGYAPDVLVCHQVSTRVTDLLATAFRYGRGQGYTWFNRAQGGVFWGWALMGGMLRLAALPVRASRYAARGVSVRDAVAFAALDVLVTFWSGLGAMASTLQLTRSRASLRGGRRSSERVRGS